MFVCIVRHLAAKYFISFERILAKHFLRFQLALDEFHLKWTKRVKILTSPKKVASERQIYGGAYSFFSAAAVNLFLLVKKRTFNIYLYIRKYSVFHMNEIVSKSMVSFSLMIPQNFHCGKI